MLQKIAFTALIVIILILVGAFQPRLVNEVLNTTQWAIEGLRFLILGG